MDLTRVIFGPVVTEKAERQKAAAKHTYTLKIHPHATKVDVRHALKEFYDLDAASVRILRVRSKTRTFGRGGLMEKRHPSKRAIVTAAAGSKPLDLASFKTS